MADKPTTSLEKSIQTGIDTALKDIHTCLPAVVTNVTHSTQLIDAQVTIKRKMAGKLVNLPLLVNVPIRFPKSATFSITFPIEVGDHVLILFSERSIDTWLTYGGIQDPFDIRKFSLSDAFAIPSMYPQTDTIPDFDDTNLEIKTNSGDTKIIVKASEDVEVITTGEVKADCATLLADVSATAVVNATTSITATTPLLTLNGNLQVNGTITSTTSVSAPLLAATTGSGSLTVRGVETYNHNHTQGPDSNSDTQQTTSGMV